MNIKIKSWYGRTGNNIMQLSRAIKIGLYHNYNIIIPEHPHINTTYIVLDKAVSIYDKCLNEISDEYFYPSEINIDNKEEIFSSNHEETLKILKSIFTINEDESLGENDLVIHIRSGDLFDNDDPHPKYVCPPLAFYLDILEGREWENVYLVAEDTLNPTISKLLELYPSTHFTLQSLDDDMKLILKAQNLVSSFGTFIPALSALSNNIKTLYRPCYGSDPLCRKQVESFVMPLSKYKEMMTPWQNSKLQNYTMLHYDMSHEVGD